MSDCRNYNAASAICWACVAPKTHDCFEKLSQSPQAGSEAVSAELPGCVPKQRKKVHIPTDENGKPDYENIRTTAKEAREISDGKVIKAFISW